MEHAIFEFFKFYFLVKYYNFLAKSISGAYLVIRLW